MTLRSLLAAAGIAAPPLAADPEVTSVVEDSRAAGPGALFVAVRGSRADGISFAAEAVARGAVAVLAEADAGGAVTVPWVRVSDARVAVAAAAAALHGFPGDRLVLTGVTGSKGKTTTSYLVAAVAEAAGEPTALLTTVSYRTGAGSEERPAWLTTPSAPALQAMLAEAVAAKQTGAVIEVSSHALDQARVHGLTFAAGVFTNLFADHLDYHPTVDDYFAAKRRLFAGAGACQRAAIGVDSRHGLRLAAEHPRAVTFGAVAEADVRPIEVVVTRQGVKLVASVPGGRQVVLDSQLLGRHNAANLLAAAAYAVVRELPLEALREGVRRVERIPGRMEPVELGQPFSTLVDYAHTGPALEAALDSVREWTSGRTLVVFGCGGNRDPERRRTMGEAAARLAGLAFLTSDNPRDEDPALILATVAAAYRAAGGVEATVIPDRAQAIAAAVEAARPGDTLVVAGKGHETVQVVGGERRPFDDREVVAAALRARGYGA